MARLGVAGLALGVALAGCGGGSATAPSSSGPSLDGTWRFTGRFADGSRACSQTGTLTLHQEGLVKGDFYSYLKFVGSLTITDCTCPDLTCVGGPASLAGSFLSTGSFLGNVGDFGADLGMYGFSCETFFVHETERDRLSGPVECSFGPWSPRPPGETGTRNVPKWAADGTWVAERQ